MIWILHLLSKVDNWAAVGSVLLSREEIIVLLFHARIKSVIGCRSQKDISIKFSHVSRKSSFSTFTSPKTAPEGAFRSRNQLEFPSSCVWGFIPSTDSVSLISRLTIAALQRTTETQKTTRTHTHQYSQAEENERQWFWEKGIDRLVGNLLKRREREEKEGRKQECKR